MRLKLNANSKKTLITIVIMIAITIVLQLLSKSKIIVEYLFARGLARIYFYITSTITSIIGISLLETFFILLIIGIILFLTVGFFKNTNTEKELKVYKAFFIGAFCIMTIFNITGTSLYNRMSVADGLGLNTDFEVSQDIVIETAEYYLSELLTVYDKFELDENGSAISPYTFRELNNLINIEYNKLADNKYFNKKNIKLKPITFSKPMTYTGITGIYFSVIGEGSINTNVPASSLPVTMAHEMGHSKGVMVESQANSIAYYICINSENDFLRYSGLLDAFLVSVSRVQDNEIRKEILTRLPQQVRNEYINYDNHFDKYTGVIQKISNWINDKNIKGSGDPNGVMSYSMTDKFVIALYKDRTKTN